MWPCRHYVIFNKFSFWGATFSTADQFWQSYIHYVILKRKFSEMHPGNHLWKFCCIKMGLKIDFRKNLVCCCSSTSHSLLQSAFPFSWRYLHSYKSSANHFCHLTLERPSCSFDTVTLSFQNSAVISYIRKKIDFEI